MNAHISLKKKSTPAGISRSCSARSLVPTFVLRNPLFTRDALQTLILRGSFSEEAGCLLLRLFVVDALLAMGIGAVCVSFFFPPTRDAGAGVSAVTGRTRKTQISFIRPAKTQKHPKPA